MLIIIIGLQLSYFNYLPKSKTMKTFFLTTIILVSLLLSINTAQAQANLNQTELFKQWIGSWKYDLGKDTTGFWELKLFGTGIEGYWKEVTKGKIVTEGKQLLGYDKKIDKYVFARLIKGEDIGIWATWFISNNKFIIIPYSDIANPDNTSLKVEVEFKSPNLFVETLILNGKPVKTYNMKRIK